MAVEVAVGRAPHLSIYLSICLSVSLCILILLYLFIFSLSFPFPYEKNFHMRYAHTATGFANTLEYCNYSSLYRRAPAVAVTGGR